MELVNIRLDAVAKYPEKISEIPASVYVMTRLEIEQSGYDSLLDILYSVPGLYFVDTYTNSVSGLRGISGTGGSDMVFLVNGVEQNRDLLDFFVVPVETIDRVEIIRGPMSVIYGNGAFLGVINIITNDYSHQQTEVVAGYSGASIDGYRVGLQTGKTTDSMSFKANLATNYSAGIDANYADMMDATQQANLVPENAHSSTYKDLEKAYWTANVVGEVGRFYGQLQRDHVNNEAWIITSSFDEGNRSITDSLVTNFGYRIPVNNHEELRLEVRYKDLKEKFNYDFISSNSDSTSVTRTSKFDIEASYFFNPKSNLEMILGARFTRDLISEFSIDVPDFGFANKVIDSDKDTYALYAQPKYFVTDNLILVAGVRIEKEMDFYKTVTGDSDLPTLALGKYKVEPVEEYYFVPRLAAIYDIDQRHLFKALYGEANRGGDGITSSLEAIGRREKTQTYELNYQYVSETVLVSSSVYYTELKNLTQFFQTFDPVDGFQVETKYSGRQHSEGIELWFRYLPTNNLSFDLSTTQAHVRSEATSAVVGNAPRSTYKFKALLSQNDFYYGLEARYTGTMYPDWSLILPDGDVVRTAQKVDSYWVADANVRYEPHSKNYALNIRVENIANTKIRYPASENAPFTYGLAGPGRTFILTGHYYFE